MAANTSPIFSAKGDIQGLAGVLTTAAADYTGQSINNYPVFRADPTNGGFIQRLRFKARGGNVATVARIYLSAENTRLVSSIAAVTGTPTGTPNTTGGTLLAGTYYAKIVAVDQYGAETVASTETAVVTTTGTTSSITWSWTPVTGAAKYEIYVGPVTNGQMTLFIQTDGTASSYTQTTALGTTNEIVGIVADTANFFYGELSLPATIGSNTVATPDIDYPMNIALPAGYYIIVGLGTTVASGWEVTAIGGAY